MKVSSAKLTKQSGANAKFFSDSPPALLAPVIDGGAGSNLEKRPGSSPCSSAVSEYCRVQVSQAAEASLERVQHAIEIRIVPMQSPPVFTGDTNKGIGGSGITGALVNYVRKSQGIELEWYRNTQAIQAERLPAILQLGKLRKVDRHIDRVQACGAQGGVVHLR